MADVRSLLKNERQARRVTHPYASYSTMGKLTCLICQIQLKSESLWLGHLSSSQHHACVQRLENEKASKDSFQSDIRSKNEQNDHENVTTTDSAKILTGRKRKASESGDDEDERKRRKHSSEELVEQSTPGQPSPRTPSKTTSNSSSREVQLPSRPATPQKALENPTVASKTANALDENEWAAFEAEIAVADKDAAADAIISAPAISAAELEAQSIDETSAQRKERQEAELEGDKEDATRKLEEEFEEMEGFEARVRKLKEKREALRLASKDTTAAADAGQPTLVDASEGKQSELYEEDEEEDEESDEDDDWDGFRLK